MFKTKVLNYYILKIFLKILLNTSLIFFSLLLILNLFDEISFFKEMDVNFLFPLLMAFLKTPLVLYKIFPFIFLISSILLFLKIIEREEIITMKVSGISNYKIILLPTIISFVLGIILVSIFNPVTSLFTYKYYEIKNHFSNKNDFLAAITENGIWIKDISLNNTNLIKADRLINNELIDVSIYVFNKNNENVSRFEAKKANIKNKNWRLSEVRIFDGYNNANIKSNFENSYLFETNINVESIQNLFSKLETVSFWKLNKIKSNYEDIGYSTDLVDLEFHKGISYPFFIMAMTFLASVIMLHTKYKVNTLYHVIFGIFISVVIFYLNDLSKVLGQTEKISLIQSVWIPIIIVFILSIVGSIQINDN